MISLVSVLVLTFTASPGFGSKWCFEILTYLQTWNKHIMNGSVVCGLFCLVRFLILGFFVNQYKSEYVECFNTRRFCCSEFMRTQGGCPTWRGLRDKSLSVVSRVIWMWGGKSGKPGTALGVWWTIWKANNMQVLNWQLASQNGCGLIFILPAVFQQKLNWKNLPPVFMTFTEVS